MSTAGEKVSVVCPSCNKRLLVPGASLGKQGRCPACQTVFTLEQMWEAEAVPAPANNDFAGFGQSNDVWGAATPAANSFGSPSNNSNDDYQLQPAANSFAANNYAPTVNSPYASPQYTSVPAYQAPAKGQFWDSSVLGGIALMVISVVWLFGGLALGVFFPYPIFLFFFGMVVLVKGIFARSISGG
jgi:hypothetical protein